MLRSNSRSSDRPKFPSFPFLRFRHPLSLSQPKRRNFGPVTLEKNSFCPGQAPPGIENHKGGGIITPIARIKFRGLYRALKQQDVEDLVGQDHAVFAVADLAVPASYAGYHMCRSTARRPIGNTSAKPIPHWQGVLCFASQRRLHNLRGIDLRPNNCGFYVVREPIGRQNHLTQRGLGFFCHAQEPK